MKVRRKNEEKEKTHLYRSSTNRRCVENIDKVIKNDIAQLKCLLQAKTSQSLVR